jgi:NADPH:quinone reductase-like Zn-dependent oxidoreductase
MRNQRVVVSNFGGPECLRVIEEEVPRPGVGEVRVRVLAAGVSFADLLMREGVHPERRRPPFTLGWDVVGRVDAIGENLHGFHEGQIVAALPIRGGYSRFLCLPGNELVTAPAGVDPASAVCLVMDYVVGYQMLRRSVSLESGDRVLIHGASGGCGTALLQLGKLMGLRMFGTVSRKNHEHVHRFGGEPIDYGAEDFVDRIQRDGRVHAVFDGVGGSNLYRSYRCLLRGGTLVFYGMTSALRHGRRSLSSLVSSVAYPAGGFALNLLPDGRTVKLYSIQMRKRRHPEDYLHDLGRLLELLGKGEISPVVARCFDLQDAAAAHDLLARKAFPGKIVLTDSD